MWGRLCRAISPTCTCEHNSPAKNRPLAPRGQPPSLARRALCDSLVCLLPPQASSPLVLLCWALSAHDAASRLCSYRSLRQECPCLDSSPNSCSFVDTPILAACAQEKHPLRPKVRTSKSGPKIMTKVVMTVTFIECFPWFKHPLCSTSFNPHN